MSSHADDGAAESCWRWCCRYDLATMRYQCRVMLAMAVLRRIGHGAISMPSHAGDGAATQGCTGCDKVVQP
jgi:hypothetical protein